MTVEKFFDLLKPDGDIGVMQQQNNAILLFPNLVNRTRMTIWRPSMPIYKGSLRILVGVAAAYSTSDMELMDRLSEIRMIIADDIRFDVFDVGSCKSMEEIDNYIPGIGKVYQTPLVGIWEYGVITRKASGAAARDLVSSVVGHNL